MLKSYGWGGVGGGPCEFSVSPWSKSFLGGLLFNMGVCWDLDLDLDQGLTIHICMASPDLES